ncbi:MAG TPA: DUF2520 domain-containing protein [Bdellovibrionota bacterium]|nr:DUF2520 domain-containing protein [Bdellovibrionota bacterium]
MIVGSGRLARHWKHYLQLEGLPFYEWSRRDSERLADFVKTRTIGAVYLLISDASLEPFYREHRSLLPASVPWFHASGALVIEGMLDAHPMMTFAEELYDLECYRSLSITTAAPVAALESTLFADLQNVITTIAPEDKARYHALCVLGAAGTGALWTLLEKEWQALGITPTQWRPYQAQIFANLLSQGRRAITGPWVRGDQVTTTRNFEALESPSSRKLYETLKGVFDEYREH